MDARTEGVFDARIVRQQTAIVANLNELRDRVEALAVKAGRGRRVDSTEVQELLFYAALESGEWQQCHQQRLTAHFMKMSLTGIGLVRLIR